MNALLIGVGKVNQASRYTVRQLIAWNTMLSTIGRLPVQSISLAITGLLITTVSLAQSYESGHQALQVWNSEGMANTPTVIKIWLYFMLVTFAAGLLFVRKHIEARVVVVGVIVALLITKWFAPMLGIVVLSGFVALVHLICWSPALFLLLKRRIFIKQRSFYALWCGWVTVVIIISFVFDIRDAAIYVMHMAAR